MTIISFHADLVTIAQKIAEECDGDGLCEFFDHLADALCDNDAEKPKFAFKRIISKMSKNGEIGELTRILFANLADSFPIEP